MNTQNISINNKTYTVKFGIKSNYILAEMWGVNKLSQVGKKLESLQFKDNEEPTLPQLVVMSELVLSGILAKQPNADVDVDDVFNFIASNSEDTQLLMNLYTKSLPQEKADRSKNANPDRKKK